ncbi:Chaperone protein HscC [compost metagenome]
MGQESSGSMTFIIDDATYEMSLNRDEFEKISAQLMLRLRHPIERALRDAALSPRDMDAVILIGGATRMPIIKSIVTKMFGRLPFAGVNPDETVALGAAIQVALKERNESLKEVVLTDVCPYTLGIETTKRMGSNQFEDGHFSPIIERNTPIPVSKVESYCTLHDQQKQIAVDVYQGESRLVANNIKLGELEIDVPPDKAGAQSIDVRFTYDINGILEVEVTTQSTGAKKTIIIEKNPGLLTQEDIQRRLNELKDIKIHPRERSENRLLLARGERLYEEALGEKREEIAFLLLEFEKVLASQNEQEVKKAAAKLSKQLEHLEKWSDYY